MPDDSDSPSEVFDDPRFAAGVAEFNGGHFFEAHEVWEDQWNDLVGDPRQFVQGLIQIAAGYLKYELGNLAAARTLWEKGVGRIAASGISADDSRVVDLLATVRKHVAGLAVGAVVEPPRLEWRVEK